VTLVVSLIVPDGVVLAADSLATTTGRLNIVGQIEGKCDKCGADIKVPELKLPPIPIPSSTTPFAQKVFNFKNKFGVAFWGNASVNKQTMYSQMKRLENRTKEEIDSVDDAADTIANHFIKELEAELGDLNKMPADVSAFGFHVVGYGSAESIIGKVWSIRIGRTVKKESHNEFGCHVSGERQVVSKLWKKDESIPVPRPRYGSFTLQDAIDYTDFLIKTTSDYQRFANMIPTVGGEADIALVTHYAGFKWIRCKQLTRIIEATD
jgi:hypothetical protein